MPPSGMIASQVTPEAAQTHDSPELGHAFDAQHTPEGTSLCWHE
jgi:hypothetical protein